MLKLTFVTDFFDRLRKEKKIKKLRGKPARSLANFKKAYPSYRIGINNYGVPSIKNPHKDAALSIGSYCSIAPNVKIYMGGMHRTDWVTTYPFPAFEGSAQHINNFAPTNGNVTIGSDVWLCANCVILSGVTIGHGAVIANSAIVTKDVPPYAIVGGNPAKLIRWRFDEATRNALLDSKWWDWPETEVLSIVDMLCSNNIATFLEYVKNRCPSPS
ncbi:MAG: CatB-related O-acetyltransferase [Methylotenera sp.]